MKRLILALIGLALALAACSAKSATTATTATTAAPATTIATTTSTTDLALLRSQYSAAVTPLGQAINTWHTEYAQLQSQAATTGYVSPGQIAAVTNPVITVMQTTVNNLSNISFPVAIESDVRSLIAALSAFEGDERQVVLEWPNAQSVQAQGTADVAKVNAASALVNADLSG